MSTEAECLCCTEIPQVRQELERAAELTNSERAKCIVDHPGFRSVCLDVWVLETAWLQYSASYSNPYDGPPHKKYRHIAYRQFVRLVWKYLGRHIRVRVPACAMKVIRTTFPAPSNEDYIGFRLPDV